MSNHLALFHLPGSRTRFVLNFFFLLVLEKYAEQGKEGVWYFFARRVKKYPNGTQADRSAVNGYWKATEADKAIEIFLDGGMNGKITGMKKTLVFFNVDGDTTVRKNKEGKKTAWTMYEYRITEFVQSSPETKVSH